MRVFPPAEVRLFPGSIFSCNMRFLYVKISQNLLFIGIGGFAPLFLFMRREERQKKIEDLALRATRVEGVELVEPDTEEIGRWSTCCGGGNMETTHPELSARMGERRLQALKETGASVIITNCPACEMQLNHTGKKTGADMKVVDILRLLDDSL